MSVLSLRARFAQPPADEEGFTLVELMVVALILAIIIAIAVPASLGARQKAQERAAQSNLRNSLAAIKIGYADAQSYITAASQLASIEPSLQYISAVGASSTGQSQIVIHAVDAQNVGMAVFAADGVCLELFDSTMQGTAGTTYGSVPNSTATTCMAPGAALPGMSW